MNSKSTSWSFNWEHISMFFSISGKKLSLCHHWGSTITEHSVPTIALRRRSKEFPSFSWNFFQSFWQLLKSCVSEYLWMTTSQIARIYRYKGCARYLRIACLNVLYFTCTNSHNFLNFDFVCFANANFYKLLNQEFFGNTKFCGSKIFSVFSETKFFWNKLKQHRYVVLGPLI